MCERGGRRWPERTGTEESQPARAARGPRTSRACSVPAGERRSEEDGAALSGASSRTRAPPGPLTTPRGRTRGSRAGGCRSQASSEHAPSSPRDFNSSKPPTSFLRRLASNPVLTMALFFLSGYFFNIFF